MHISSSAYMGTETLVRLAVQNMDNPYTTQGLAECINRSVSYTESLVARLSNAGIIVSRQVPGGGYMLARPANRISVAEVFQAFDDPSDFANGAVDADTLEVEDVGGLLETGPLRVSLKSHILLFLNGVSLADITPKATGLIGADAIDDTQIYPFNMQSTTQH